MKKLVFIATAAVSAVFVSGCGNIDLLDTNLTYHRAIVKWPDGSAREIQIKQWRDYEGEQVQIIAKDGKTYLISMNNAVLIRD